MSTYPVKKKVRIAATGTPNATPLEVKFRPSLPGLIHIVSVVTGVPIPEQAPGGGLQDPPNEITLEQTVELYAANQSSPVLREVGRRDLTLDGQMNQLVVSGHYLVSTLSGADWTVRITNPRADLHLECDLTIRYPTVVGNLGKIDHIVVLMMENRSFDHFLGYLQLEGGRTDVNGLTADKANPDEEGREYRVHHLNDTVFRIDPAHNGDDVTEQLQDGNRGFVKNFAKRRAQSEFSEEEPLGNIMGYHNATQVPAYDFLAREFAICDQWFCSVPGSTWPNRLYSLAGGSRGEKKNPHIGSTNPPGYDLKSIFEVLQEFQVDWMSYYSDVPFALLFRKIAQDAAYTERIRPMRFFFDRLVTGELPAVSWLEPNYEDLPENENANDDHPPADITRGQEFIAKLYRALVSSPAWAKTLLLITYDEHGGFYDHVVPPETADDHPNMRQYGVRVPSFVVSPWTAPGVVSKETYDHTSLIKTILERFCKLPEATDGGLPDMGARVRGANHVGSLLTAAEPRTNMPEMPVPPAPSGNVVVPAHRGRREDDFSMVLRSALFGF